MDGVADDIGRALLALGSFGHGVIFHVSPRRGSDSLAKNLALIFLTLVSAALFAPVKAHPPITLVFAPIPNPHPHPITDARDAIETARVIWLSQNPTSGAQYREKWDETFSATHEGRAWVLRQPGWTINVDEMDGHIISATVGD